MKNLYNQNELIQLFGETSNLFGIIQGLERQFELQGQVICKVKLNGQSLSEEQEVSNANLNILAIQNIEVETSAPQAVLSSVVDQWIENIPFVIAECDRLGGMFRTQGLESASPTFSNLLRNCQMLVDSMESALPLIKSDAPRLVGQWLQSETRMYVATKDALAAFEKKDLNTLADVIEYDLAHCLELWRELLIAFRGDSKDGGEKRIESDPGQPAE